MTFNLWSVCYFSKGYFSVEPKALALLLTVQHCRVNRPLTIIVDTGHNPLVLTENPGSTCCIQTQVKKWEKIQSMTQCFLYFFQAKENVGLKDSVFLQYPCMFHWIASQLCPFVQGSWRNVLVLTLLHVSYSMGGLWVAAGVE